MERLIIYTDGGSRGNPGPSAIGVVVINEAGEEIKKYSEYIGETTNNAAEYRAVIFALKKIKQLFGRKTAKDLAVEINSDSELLVSQLQGLYKILEPRIGDLFLKIWNLKIDFKNVKFNLIPRERNKTADKLVNEVLDNQAKIQKLTLN